MIISSTSVTFSPEHVLKHENPGRKLDVFEHRTYRDAKLYTRRRNDKIDKDQKRLFITHRKPYPAPSTLHKK